MSAAAIVIAASAGLTNTVRADSAASALRILDATPSQDIADDDLTLAPNTRVAQFNPFQFIFGPRVAAPPPPPPRIHEAPVQRRRVERHNNSTDEVITRSSRVTRQTPSESLKDRIRTMLRNPPPIPETNGPLLLTVSIAKQTVTLYDGGVQIAKAPVSTGTVDRPSPLGVFSVLERSWWHRSNMYSAAPMPFMQRITWSGVALHAGELPGYRASHGCIRLPDSFALRLWYTTRIGARVVIAWDELTPLQVSHPLLFQPSPVPLPPVAPPRPLQPDEIIMSMIDTAPSQDDPADGADGPRVLAADEMPQETASADEDPELAHMMLAAADDGAGLFEEPPAYAEAEGIALPLIPASLTVTDILRPKPHIEGDVFALARQKAKPKRRVVRAVAPEPEIDTVLRPGPISVLISRKDKRIYVRKGLQPVFSMPVTIADPERPFGTHVYTASALDDDGVKFAWTAVSPNAEARERADIARPTAAALAALDRITIPDSAVNRIEPLLSLGATLIVTDMGLGRTANLLDSDFTVLLRPEFVSNEMSTMFGTERRRSTTTTTYPPLFR